MAEIKRILLPTDFSKHANQALRHAARLATEFDAELVLLHVVSVFEDDPYDEAQHFPDMEAFYTQLEDSARARMAKHAPHFENIETSFETLRSISPADEILTFATKSGIDLVVMGTHGRAAISHFLLGSIAEKVVRHAHCPVVTVAHQEDTIYDFPKLQRLLVPIDFSDHSKLAVKHAATLAKKFKADIDFLHVVDQRVHPSYYVMGEASLLQVFPDIVEKSTAKLEEFVGELLSQKNSGQVYIREGNPHTEIVKFAQEHGADMIVMATHGLSGLEKLIIGSTAEKVVRKATCPTFTVKPKHAGP